MYARLPYRHFKPPRAGALTLDPPLTSACRHTTSPLPPRSCNWLGVADWATHLTWSRGEEFSKEPLRAWYASPELAHEGNETVRAGEFRQVGRFALAGVDGAGHFVGSAFSTSLFRHCVCDERLSVGWKARRGQDEAGRWPSGLCADPH